MVNDTAWRIEEMYTSGELIRNIILFNGVVEYLAGDVMRRSYRDPLEYGRFTVNTPLVMLNSAGNQT